MEKCNTRIHIWWLSTPKSLRWTMSWHSKRNAAMEEPCTLHSYNHTNYSRSYVSAHWQKSWTHSRHIRLTHNPHILIHSMCWFRKTHCTSPDKRNHHRTRESHSLCDNTRVWIIGFISDHRAHDYQLYIKWAILAPSLSWQKSYSLVYIRGGGTWPYQCVNNSHNYDSAATREADSSSYTSDQHLACAWFDSGPKHCSGSDFPQLLQVNARKVP
jgi:hypothetical protein